VLFKEVLLCVVVSVFLVSVFDLSSVPYFPAHTNVNGTVLA